MPFSIFSFPSSQILHCDLFGNAKLPTLMVLLTRTYTFRSPLKERVQVPDTWTSSPPLYWKDEMSSLIFAEIRQFNIWLQLNLFEPGNTFVKNYFACWVWPWWKTRFTNLWHLMETCTLDLLPKLPLNILARAWPPKFIASSWYKVIVRIHFPRFLCLFIQYKQRQESEFGY